VSVRVLLRSALASASVLVLGVAPLAADSIRSEVDARRVGVADMIELTLTVEGQLLEEVPLPPLTNARVVSGPSVSTQVSILNGQMTQSRTWTWVLKPGSAGKAEVGPARAKFASGEQSAPAIPIEVVAGSVKPSRPSRRTNPFTDPFGAMDPFEGMRGRRGPAAEPHMALEAKVNRTSLHVGEPLLLTYYLYTQVSPRDLQPVEAPKYPGFWVEDLERPKGAPNGESATLDGIPYRRFAIMQKLLYPMRAGPLTIPASTMKIGTMPLGFFDSGVVVERSTKPLTVDVKPIPDEPGFSGAVGRFKASARLDRDALALGEAATLRFTVEGTGNLKWVDRAPELKVEGARVYPPQTKSDLKAGLEGLAGSKTWEFVVVPQTTGTLEVPALAFSYFDPASSRVVRAETKEMPLRVEGGTAAAGVPAMPASRPAAGAGAPLPLRTSLDLPRAALPILGGRTVGLAALAVLALHALLFGASALGGYRRSSDRPPAPKRSVRAALRDLERVGKDGMSKEASATLIEKALHDVFGELDGDDSERARAVGRLRDDVHFVRYAPQLGDYSEKLRELAARAADVVNRWA
jgi:BatD DUF11 like domain